MNRWLYSEEDREKILMNPYTHSVSKRYIKHTLEFKEFFLSRKDVPGMTSRKIFIEAGYDPNIISPKHIENFRTALLQEVAKNGAPKAPTGMSEEQKVDALAKKDLSKQKTDASIKELQERIVHLEAQVRFLKKIQSLHEE